MLQHFPPEGWVIAIGESRRLQEIVVTVLACARLD
jgi:hypothetical protein